MGLIHTLANTGAADPSRMRLGNRLVCLGDSQTIAGDTVSGNTPLRTESFALWASLYSKGALDFVYNAGHGGDTSVDMLARFDTDVTPHKPNIVTVLSGANDGNQGISQAKFIATIKQIIAKCSAIGAVPVLMTTPPNNYTSGTVQETAMRGYNSWIVRYAASAGLPCVDLCAVVSDPTKRWNYLTAYDVGDGIHPSQAGHEAIGLALWNTLSASVVPNAELLTQYLSDPNNLIAGGLMLTDTNADGVSDNWTVYNNPANGSYTRSVVTDAAVLGKMQRLTVTGAINSPNTVEQSIAIGGGKFAVGDVVRYTGIVTSTGGTKAQVFLNFPGGGLGITWYVNAAVTRGRFSIETTVPTGTTSLEPQLTAGGGTGTVDFGQVTLYNLTRQGVVNL